MKEKIAAIDQLKNVLKTSGYDVLGDRAYEMLKYNHMIVNEGQARAMAEIAKDVATTNYATGYADGRAEQAYQDGLRSGQEGVKNN